MRIKENRPKGKIVFKNKDQKKNGKKKQKKGSPESNPVYVRLQNSRFFFSKSVKKSAKRGVRVLRARSA